MDISNDKIIEAYGKVPAPIREFIAEGELGTVAQGLAKKYNLHIDSTGVLIEILTKTLLGFTNPEQLPEILSSRLGLEQPSVSEFIKELNMSVFMPLQKKVREMGSELSHEERVAASNPEPTQALGPNSAASKSATQPQIPVMQIGAVSPTDMTPQLQPASQPQIAQEPPPYNLIQPESPAVPPETVSIAPARTMANDVKVLTHPELVPAQQEQGTMPSVPHPWQTSPAQSFQTASVPYTSMPVSSRPVPAPPPVELPTGWAPEHTQAAERPVFKAQTTPMPLAASKPEPLIKEYGSDPYREPIA